MELKKKLYLIPVDIGYISENGFFPKYQQEIVFSIKHFIVEKATTARRFLKAIDYPHEMRSVEMIEFNEHNRDNILPEIKEFIESADIIGLMSEAGLPCVADPGSEVVALAHSMGVKLIPFYGPSSIMMALMASGFSGQKFVFHGYLPAKKEKRGQALKRLAFRIEKDKYTHIFMETPYRTMPLFDDILLKLPGNFFLSVASEINTPDEQIITKSLNQWKRSRPELHKKRCIFLISY